MKKIYALLFVLFTVALGYSQTPGITYQAVIMNPDGEQFPGNNLSTAPLSNKNICMQFSILDKDAKVEYEETMQTSTDKFGMVNLLIGTGTQTGGYAAGFAGINWGSAPKNLKVAFNAIGTCSDFIEISNQPFSAVPYALASDSANIIDGSIKDSKIESLSADKITGILAIENGGTGAATVTDAKINFGLENIDNTSDINKPVSIAMLTALDSKENLANKSTNVSADATSDIKYPSVKAIKTYVDSNANNGSTALTNEINRATAAENTIATNLTTETNTRAAAVTTLTTNLNTEIANRTSADLLKEDLANKSTNVTTDGASDTKYPSVKSVKTYVDASASNGSNALTNEINRATAAENTITNNLTSEANTRATAVTALTTNLNAEITNRTNADLLKEDILNKSTNVTADGASDTKYPSVKSVKTYVDASATASSTALTNEINRATAAEATKADKTNGSTQITDPTAYANIGTAAVATQAAINSGVNTKLGTLAIDTNVVHKAGDTMTGLLVLSADPAANLGAATKQYTDGKVSQTITSGVTTSSPSQDTVSTALALKAPLASPTFTGNVNTSGTITAGTVTYPNAHGTSGQVLSTTSSGTLAWITPSTTSEAADEYSSTASQTTFTLSETPKAGSKVKMYINGIRISNSAYDYLTVPGNVTYDPASNGGYNLTAGDRIQFDYTY